MQLALLNDSDSQESTAVIKHQIDPIYQAQQEETRYEGWSNSTTWMVSLYVVNERDLMDHIETLRREDGSLDPRHIEQYIAPIIITERELSAGVEELSRAVAAVKRSDGSIDRAKLEQYRSPPNIAKQDLVACIEAVVSSNEPVEHDFPSQYLRLFPRKRLVLDNWITGEVNWQEITESWFDEASPGIKSDALRELAAAEIEGDIVRLRRQLDRELYLKVNRILDALGGKWNRAKKGHVFESDPTDAIENVVLTGRFVAPENHGYFPTPRDLAERLVVLAQVSPGMKVLEPSAGQAGIADVLAEIVGRDHVVVYELLDRNVEVLRRKGYSVEQADFLTIEPQPRFPRIVMNPPFARQEDVRHVIHAFKFLEPGGRLVSVMSSSITFRDNRITEEFREFVKAHGTITENPPGSFKKSGTMVNTVTVVLNKPRTA